MSDENSAQQQQDDIDTQSNEQQQILESTNNNNEKAVEQTIEQQSINDNKQMITEIELTPEEQIDKQKAEKVFRKQEEEWLNKREKVRQIVFRKLMISISTTLQLESFRQ